jgi:antitoxin component of MazEF toxin-antitoxin module
MRTQLVNHGNSKAIVISAGIRKLLGISDDTQLEVTTDGKSLVLTPAQSGREAAAFEKARKGFFSDPQHRRALIALSK